MKVQKTYSLYFMVCMCVITALFGFLGGAAVIAKACDERCGQECHINACVMKDSPVLEGYISYE